LQPFDADHLVSGAPPSSETKHYFGTIGCYPKPYADDETEEGLITMYALNALMTAHGNPSVGFWNYIVNSCCKKDGVPIGGTSFVDNAINLNKISFGHDLLPYQL